jgi:hypothetical protein
VTIDESANKEIFSINISKERNRFVVAHSISRPVSFETMASPHPFSLLKKNHRENIAVDKGEGGEF